MKIEVVEDENKVALNNGKIKVIGVGLGKTGTNNLRFALNELGYNCYHMSEVFVHPKHADVWLDALDKKDVDWDELFGDYDAAVDWPSCYFYKVLFSISLFLLFSYLLK